MAEVKHFTPFGYSNRVYCEITSVTQEEREALLDAINSANLPARRVLYELKVLLSDLSNVDERNSIPY